MCLLAGLACPSSSSWTKFRQLAEIGTMIDISKTKSRDECQRRWPVRTDVPRQRTTFGGEQLTDFPRSDRPVSQRPIATPLWPSRDWPASVRSRSPVILFSCSKTKPRREQVPGAAFGTLLKADPERIACRNGERRPRPQARLSLLRVAPNQGDSCWTRVTPTILKAIAL